nr:MAG TPA: hypothetical protein [Caudoviricetes sp.]
MAPNDVLDLEYWQFLACCEGYNDRLTDLTPLSVLNGYWSAYYNNTKHPRKPTQIIQKMNASSEKANISKKAGPDIERFERLEKKRLEYEQKQQEVNLLGGGNKI